MTLTLLSIILTATLGGTGAVGLKYYLDRRQPPVQVEHNLEQVIGDIVQEHVQRNSEDSDIDITINIHTHNKEK